MNQKFIPMDYYFSKKLDISFDEAIELTTDTLSSEGFGVLTEIDIKGTLKKKINVDTNKYHILGACNPPSAYEAIQNEPHIGLMLPCNVIVREDDDGEVEVAAIDPVASMQAVENPGLGNVAKDVRNRLKKVIDNL